MMVGLFYSFFFSSTHRLALSRHHVSVSGKSIRSKTRASPRDYWSYERNEQTSKMDRDPKHWTEGCHSSNGAFPWEGGSSLCRGGYLGGNYPYPLFTAFLIIASFVACCPPRRKTLRLSWNPGLIHENAARLNPISSSASKARTASENSNIYRVRFCPLILECFMIFISSK